MFFFNRSTPNTGIFDSCSKKSQNCYKIYPWKNAFNKIDAWWMFFTEFWVIHGAAISRRVQRLQNYLCFFYLHVEDNTTIFFERALCCLVYFLRKLWVWEKIYLIVKQGGVKNLPWEREKSSESIVGCVTF